MKEKIKSYILLLLVIASIIQVGILWGYQNHGFPTIFINSLFVRNPGEPSDKNIRDEYFMPFRIVATDGNQSHWIISRNDPTYDMLWENAASLLSQMLKSKIAPVAVSDIWGTIVSKRGFVFEFKAGIPSDLLGWFLELPSVPQDTPSRFSKIMVVPAGLNNNINIYLLERQPSGPEGESNGGKVWKYEAANAGTANKTDIFASTLSRMRNNSILAYKTKKELFPNSFKYISDDILCVTQGMEGKYRAYKTVDYSVPEQISNPDANPDFVSKMLFTGNEQDSFNKYKDSSGTRIFSNLDQVYRVYPDGLLEYRYLPGYQGNDEGSVSSAFALAAKFIDHARTSFNPAMELYVSGITRKQGYYEFTFDYIVDDVPVYVDSELKADDGMPAGNTVIVRANGQRILESRWILKNIAASAGTNSYNLQITNILDNIGWRIEENTTIWDMGISYLIKARDEKKANPVWMVELADGKRQFVQLERKQGE